MNEKRISRSIEKLMKKLPERNGEDIPHISETINFRPIECQGMAEAFRREFIDNGGGNALVIKTASGYQKCTKVNTLKKDFLSTLESAIRPTLSGESLTKLDSQIYGGRETRHPLKKAQKKD